MSNMGRPKAELVLSDEESAALEQMRRRAWIGAAMRLRASIVVLCAAGRDSIDVAEELSVTPQMVGKWRRRFVDRRLEGLFDEPRVGRPRTVTDEHVQRVIDITLHEKPRAITHWSTRLLAKELKLTRDAVQRIWRAFGLKPHRSETISLSKDPQFVEKVRDVVGLYMSPPDKAVVLCLDEKSQMQALDRSQPMMPTQPERRTPTYIRHGATSLAAALDVATGSVIGKTYRRHRAAEFVRFLDDNRGLRPGGFRRPFGDGQLRNPQGGRGEALADSPPSLSSPFHSDELFVAEPRRVLLLDGRAERHPTRRAPQHPFT